MKAYSRILLFLMLAALWAAGARAFGEEEAAGKKNPETPPVEKAKPEEPAARDEGAKEQPAGPEDLFGPVFPKGKQVYTACNIWYERPSVVWCINYKRGTIIPAGTPVKDLRIGKGVSGTRRDKPTMFFTTATDGKEFQLHFDPLAHPKLSIRDYAKRMFTTKTFAELTKGMTANEIGAIKEGKLKVGMSKKAVIVSWGYPPERKTKSLEENEWIYWIWRFQKKTVFFDENGRTVRKPDRDPDEL